MTQETEQYDQLPDAIVARLRARDRGLALLTPVVDRAVEAAAREQFAPRRSRTAAAHGWRYAAAAAAAVALIAVFIAQPFAPDEALRPRLADDVDGSGRVDVLDAFALARSRANDPGSVSQSRIDSLVARIVSLDDGEVAL
jgi:anti-sigma-K factor RskA